MSCKGVLNPMYIPYVSTVRYVLYAHTFVRIGLHGCCHSAVSSPFGHKVFADLNTAKLSAISISLSGCDLILDHKLFYVEVRTFTYVDSVRYPLTYIPLES